MGYPSTILGTPNLLSYYRLEETSGTSAADSQGSNTGTYTGSYTLGGTGPTGLGNAVTFTPNSYVIAPLPTTANNNVAIEAWIFATAIGTFNQGIVYLGNNSSGYGITLNANFVANGAINIRHANQGGDRITTANVAANKWHHVVYNINSGVDELWFDGDLVYSSGPSSPNTPIGNLYIGFDGNQQYFTGMIDEVAIYSAPLSGATVAAHLAAAGDGTQQVRVAQMGMLTVNDGAPKARVAQMGNLVAYQGTPKARVAQMGMMVVYSAETSNSSFFIHH